LHVWSGHSCPLLFAEASDALGAPPFSHSWREGGDFGFSPEFEHFPGTTLL